MGFQLTNILGWQRTKSSEGSEGGSRERSNLKRGAIKRSESFNDLPGVDHEDGERSCSHVLLVTEIYCSASLFHTLSSHVLDVLA